MSRLRNKVLRLPKRGVPYGSWNHPATMQAALFWARRRQFATEEDTTPGGALDVLTDDDGLSALLDDDGATFLRDS